MAGADGVEEQERERERLVPPLGLSAKAQRMEQGGWAAKCRGESAGERSSQTQRSSHRTEVLTDEVHSHAFEDLSLDVRTLFLYYPKARPTTPSMLGQGGTL